MQLRTLSLAAMAAVVSAACAEDSELPPEFRQLLARCRIAAVTEPHFVAADVGPDDDVICDGAAVGWARATAAIYVSLSLIEWPLFSSWQRTAA